MAFTSENEYEDVRECDETYVDNLMQGNNTLSTSINEEPDAALREVLLLSLNEHRRQCKIDNDIMRLMNENKQKEREHQKLLTDHAIVAAKCIEDKMLKLENEKKQREQNVKKILEWICRVKAYMSAYEKEQINNILIEIQDYIVCDNYILLSSILSLEKMGMPSKNTINLVNNIYDDTS